MSHTLTLVLCGPHATRSWSPLYHRVDHGINVAVESNSPLLISGDAYEGRAVMHFADRAESRVRRVTVAYDSGGRTLTDAQAAIRAIRDHRELASVLEVLVVTDDWHAERCLTILRGEHAKIAANRPISFVDASTPVGPRPPSEVLEGERRGIVDYLAGTPYRPFGAPYGKPFHPTEASRHE